MSEKIVPDIWYGSGITKLEVSNRRMEVAQAVLNGESVDALAEKFNVSAQVIQLDVRIVKETWRKQATQAIGDLQARELVYALQERADCERLFTETKKSTYKGLKLEWTKRIATLMGLDAPAKSEDWTNSDWREYIQGKGVKDEEVAEALIRETITIIREQRIKDPETLQLLRDSLQGETLELPPGEETLEEVMESS